MRILTLSMALAAALASNTVLAQATEVVAATVPGAAFAAETETHTGKISAIDVENRVVTVQGDGGREAMINAGPEVKNFSQLKVGDSVTIELIRAVALELRKDSAAEPSRTDEEVRVRSAEGENPAGVVGVRAKIMAEVTAIDPAKKTVTLKGPNRSIDLAVQDPAQFENIAVGDRVEATYLEALAISVTPAAQP